jgi:hypothetical protein
MPSFPVVTYKVLLDSYTIKPHKPPAVSPFEQFNIRLRAKPGYKTAEIKQQIIIPAADWTTLRVWMRDTIIGGSVRFTQTIWDGEGWQTARTVQLLTRDPEAKHFTPTWMILPWDLTVYDLG